MRMARTQPGDHQVPVLGAKNLLQTDDVRVVVTQGGDKVPKARLEMRHLQQGVFCHGDPEQAGVVRQDP